jgi:alpha-ketoglutaric semialdehyde dehydrogenase
MSLSGKHIIGANLAASGTQTFRAFDPVKNEAIAPDFFEGTQTDVDEAAQLAKSDFDKVRNIKNSQRANFLNTIAEEILALDEELVKRTVTETGLPEARIISERGRTINQLKLFAEVVSDGSWIEARIDTPKPDRKPIPKPDIRMLNIAIGPVAVFGASNFPLAFSVAGGDTASALAAGCPVIVKGHPAHPGTSELVGKAVQAAVRKNNMPEGTFSLIQGSGTVVGEALVKHPGIKAVGFTGSFRGGKALFDLAMSRPEPIPFYAEMGSTNPIFLLPGVLKERGSNIAQDFVDSVTLGVGQFCTNPGLVFGLNNRDFENFISVASETMEAKGLGTMLHHGIKSAYDKGIEELTSFTGVELLIDKKSNKTTCDGIPRLLRTTGKTFAQHPRLEEEVFGPSSLLISCESVNELLIIAENLKGQLTATVHGTEEDLKGYKNLITILERKVGRIIFNGFPTGVEVCHSMNHGGPFPATTDCRTTSVGTAAIKRFLRPVCYQNFPQQGLPEEIKNVNKAQIWRLIDGKMTTSDVE